MKMITAEELGGLLNSILSRSGVGNLIYHHDSMLKIFKALGLPEPNMDADPISVVAAIDSNEFNLQFRDAEMRGAVYLTLKDIDEPVNGKHYQVISRRAVRLLEGLLAAGPYTLPDNWNEGDTPKE